MSQTKNDQSTIFNFNGPVGAVLTGAQAVANVQQSVDAPNEQSIVRALAVFRSSILNDASLSEEQRFAVLAHIDGASAQVGRDTTNETSLLEALKGLATAVQTLGSAQAAWHLLRSTVEACGLKL